MDGSIPERSDETDPSDPPQAMCSAENCWSLLGSPSDVDGLCAQCVEAQAVPPLRFDPARLVAHLAALEAWACGSAQDARRTHHYEAPVSPGGHRSHIVSASLRGHLVGEQGYRTVRGCGRSYAEALADLIPQLGRVERVDEDEQVEWEEP